MEFDGRDEWLPSERRTSRRYEAWRSRWLFHELEAVVEQPTWRELQEIRIEWADVVQEYVRQFDAQVREYRVFDARPRLFRKSR